jgi:hypothetical protein
MAMPETPMNEDHRPVFRQDNIRSAGKIAVKRAINGEAIAVAMQQSADDNLWFRVPSSYAGHHLGALFGREDIGHGIS